MRNGLAEHWRESYVCETGKSMQAMELVADRMAVWRKISITPVMLKWLVCKMSSESFGLTPLWKS